MLATTRPARRPVAPTTCSRKDSARASAVLSYWPSNFHALGNREAWGIWPQLSAKRRASPQLRHRPSAPAATQPPCSPTRRHRRRVPRPKRWSTTSAGMSSLRSNSGLAASAYIGGITAENIDFSRVLANGLPYFIGIIILLSALLLMVVFRSLLIPLQAAAMNLLSIGAALGIIVAVFQYG